MVERHRRYDGGCVREVRMFVISIPVRMCENRRLRQDICIKCNQCEVNVSLEALLSVALRSSFSLTSKVGSNAEGDV